MWILADAFTNAMILAGVVLLLLIVFRRFHRHFVDHDRHASTSTAKSSHPAKPVSRSVETPLNVVQWQVEMHELAASMKGELDSKMRLLQLLIGQARIEAERLEQLLAESDSRPARTEPTTAAPDRQKASADEPSQDT
jgi:hypothetical protein